MSQFSKLVKEVKSDLEEGKEEDKAHIERITYEKIQNKNLSHIIKPISYNWIKRFS